jgi:hypothetical protein
MALVPFDVDPSLRVGCPAAGGGGRHFPARLKPCLGELRSPSTCIPPHAAQRLCFNVLLSPNAKVVPAREHPDPLQPSCRAMVLVRVCHQTEPVPAKVTVDNWVSQVSEVLHEGVIYRHIILTVPAMLDPRAHSNRNLRFGDNV